MKTMTTNSKTKATWYLVNPPCTTSVEKIRKRSGYFCETVKIIENGKYCYQWQIVPRNGKPLRISTIYKNKAQCRNIGKKISNIFGIEWRQ